MTTHLVIKINGKKQTTAKDFNDPKWLKFVAEYPIDLKALYNDLKYYNEFSATIADDNTTIDVWWSR